MRVVVAKSTQPKSENAIAPGRAGDASTNAQPTAKRTANSM